MSQDKDNNEAASADLIARIVDRDTPPDGRNDVVDHDLRGNPITRGMVDSMAKAASASQSSTAVPRVGGKTCPFCDGEGVIHTGIDEAPTTQCRKCDGSGFAHVARQRQESPDGALINEGAKSAAAVADGVDTPEFCDMIDAASKAAAQPDHGERAREAYEAIVEHVNGLLAQQREAGRRDANTSLTILKAKLNVERERSEKAETDLIRALATRQPVSEGLTPDPMLKWALRELLTTLPQRRDWFNPDAEKVLRAALSAAPPAKAEGMSDTERNAERYRWLLANYARGDGYADIDAALNDGEPEKYLSPAIDAAILAQQAKGETP